MSKIKIDSLKYDISEVKCSLKRLQKEFRLQDKQLQKTRKELNLERAKVEKLEKRYNQTEDQRDMLNYLNKDESH